MLKCTDVLLVHNSLTLEGGVAKAQCEEKGTTAFFSLDLKVLQNPSFTHNGTRETRANLRIRF